MAEPQNRDPGPDISRSFARKVRLSKLALFFERFWPRLWLLIGVALVFAMVSFLGLWPYLEPLIHKLVLAAFAVAALAAILYAVRIPWPTRDDAVRRIERRSGVPHRPATSYEDTLTSGAQNAATSALWQAHRERLARAIARLRVGHPAPRTDRFDPWAVRGLLLLLLVPIAILATGSLGDRLAAAFRFSGIEQGPPARVDAWVTPPPYTALPPVLLADGGQPIADDAQGKSKFFEVPDRSLLTLRGVGFGPSGVSLEVLSDGATEPLKVAPEKSKHGDTSNVSEVRYEVRKSARVRALAGSRELGLWTFDVIADELPKIALTKDVSGTPRGSMRVSYKATDDYGIQGAEVKVRKVVPKPSVDTAKSWAQPPPLTGPRLPLERPPVLSLKIPQPGAKKVDTSTLLDIEENPLAGQRVQLWLEATDVGGQVGRSKPIEIVLPSRRFKNPLARALVEQRRKLAEDSRNRPMVVKALDALTMEPEGFITDDGVYLGMRAIYHRLDRQETREALNSSVDELWQIALQVEDGALSQAERALKDAQDRLSDAIEKGDDKEIQDAMAELKKRLNDYLNQMQKNAEKENPSQGDQQQDQSQELGQQDLDQMMKDLEKSAREGSREDAQRMLSEMRELMDRLQAANSPEARAQQKRAQQMMKKLNELSDLTGKQQQLMDDTFSQQRRREGQGGSQEDEQNGEGAPRAGNKGQQGKGQQQGGQDGMQADQQGGGEQGEGQQGQDGRSGGQQQHGKSSLQDRQAQLRNELNKLKKDLEQMGAGDPDKLGNAEESMGKAEDALKQGDMDEAANQQGQALEQMRQSAQQMAQQMQQNAQQRLGRGGNSPRDPFGRPQRAQGPDLGTSVKVPDAIDAQRAREILEELRRRSGENLRPQDELDYIDRLLKRF